VKNLKIYGRILLPFIGLLGASCASLPSECSYPSSYAVVVSERTYAESAWKNVADTLCKKRNAALLIYRRDVEETLLSLRKIFPKYICFVVKPEDAGFKWTVRTHRMVRRLDNDPFADAIAGTITGRTPDDALRLAEAAEPVTASTALISAGIGPERYKEAYFLSTGTRGLYGHKTPDGKIEKYISKSGNLAPLFAGFLDQLDPDAVITSAHASQYCLEMPFSRGAVVCRNGRLFILNRKKALINYSTGQAEGEIASADPLVPIPQPKKPKLYFSVGNCLIGDIPNKDCMALAFLGWGKGTQMIGYTTTTWFGMVGWGANTIWEQSGGLTPLNEAFFFSRQNLLYKLQKKYPPLETAEFDYLNGINVKLLTEFIRKTLHADKISRDAIGMLWDRDVVAFYGDPALEIRLDKEFTFKPLCSVKLLSDSPGTYHMVIHAEKDIPGPSDATAPVSIFFPERLKNIKIIKGQIYKPVCTDNFILVASPGPFRAGKDYEIVFTAEKIR